MKRLRITVDGASLEVPAGTTLAAALIAAGRPVFRTSARLGQPRGLYCGMGVCYECLLRIDGKAQVRACLVEVRDGMVVETGAS